MDEEDAGKFEKKEKKKKTVGIPQSLQSLSLTAQKHFLLSV